MKTSNFIKIMNSCLYTLITLYKLQFTQRNNTNKTSSARQMNAFETKQTIYTRKDAGLYSTQILDLLWQMLPTHVLQCNHKLNRTMDTKQDLQNNSFSLLHLLVYSIGVVYWMYSYLTYTTIIAILTSIECIYSLGMSKLVITQH